MVAPYLRPDGDIAPEELRAMITATSAALRLPFGATRIFNVPNAAQGTEVSANKTSSNVIFVELRAVPGQTPITFLLGPTAQLSTAIHAAFVFPAESPVRVMLYPSESLFVRGISAGQSQLLRTEVVV